MKHQWSEMPSHALPARCPSLPVAEDDDTIEIIKQPETMPISREQLVAEVKAIYAGLVFKCIEVDNILSHDQWTSYKDSISSLCADTGGKVKQRYTPSLHGLRHREVPGTINDIPVKAVPDYGSSIDAISDGFAREHGMEVKAADKISIKLPGGRVVESVGVVVGHFKFQNESQTYTRYFRVLKKCAFDMVLGREFLEQTKTLTDFCHRIVKRFRPCVEKGGRFFLLDESPKDRIRCAVNGSNASAFPDTGSDLMLVSGDFARRNSLKVHREKKYRQKVQLADGSFILTDGMVLDAELEFDAPPMSSPREVNLDQYLEYDRGLTELMNEGRGAKGARDKTVFICDLHVVEDLPCDIILSSDFIFDHQVFSRFKHLFSAEPAPTPRLSPHILSDYFLFIRSTKKRSWFRWRRRRPPTPTPTTTPTPTPLDANNAAIPLREHQSWEELWEAEEARRNRTQLRIASLPDALKAEEQRAEGQRREDWDRNHPRPPPPMRLVLPPSAGTGFGLDVGGLEAGVGGGVVGAR
ncbi:hypothetical protein B0I37DRAFT_377034 [Chaetomium sp. MPI-CAGE-AT-0009]|nr:hypothetical protein B0I37DRAFT_377034 [Chaetomium sp. MPI-CAGE-AT-0009]